jgi:hypothetical protein
MEFPSDFGGVVILADVFREVIALRSAHGFRFLGLYRRTFAGDGRRGNDATGTGSEQEITTGKLGCWGFHHILLFTKRSACLNGEKFTLQSGANQGKPGKFTNENQS